MGTIDRTEGRRAFGGDPVGYHCARPAYPERVFEILQQRCRLQPQCSTFEIGAGTGLCTRRLIDLGASPIVAVEPDDRLAAFLSQTLNPIDVCVTTFENVNLPSASFNLGVSASAFHWLDEFRSLQKITQLLCDGGWWAMWWNLFLDVSRIDEFHKATRALLDCLDRGPSHSFEGRLSFALDVRARISQMEATQDFVQIEFEDIRWSVVLNSQQIVGLYSTFSPISRLDRERRDRLLNQLGQVAEKEFGGVVELYITTPIYTAQRKDRG